MLFCFFVIGCNSNKRVAEKEKQVQLNINCPEGGNCVFEVLENSSLQLKFDDSGNLYPEVISGDKTVIKFHYKKFEIENTADSSHSEYIYLEINKSEKQLILKDHELQEVKLLFGRICFCRGSMGYFKVTQGDLFLFNHNGKLQIDLKFKVNKVPQIITEIKENINY
jgi:hypothetical protein